MPKQNTELVCITIFLYIFLLFSLRILLQKALQSKTFRYSAEKLQWYPNFTNGKKPQNSNTALHKELDQYLASFLRLLI